MTTERAVVTAEPCTLGVIMLKHPPLDITSQLAAWSEGDSNALEQAMPGLYEAMRGIAFQRIARESGVVTLDPTDLVHEAMVRLLGAGKPFSNRLHFLAVSALYMRSILTDRARAIHAGRRSSAGMSVTLSEADALDGHAGVDLLALDQTLRELEAEDPRAARAFELASFSGMTRAEIAELLSISESSIDRDLRFARAWFNDALA